jgi:hypothetical protein
MPRPHSTPGKDPVLIAQEAGWAPGPVWTGEENLAPTGIFFINFGDIHTHTYIHTYIHIQLSHMGVFLVHRNVCAHYLSTVTLAGCNVQHSQTPLPPRLIAVIKTTLHPYTLMSPKH